MTQAQPNFENTVFPAEFEEIRRRRRNLGDARPLAQENVKPSTQHDLTGLAISGGGIRSASFSMGVVQHLISTGQFQKFDYLSTVSGGGYTGSCLSALMQGEGQGEQLLVKRHNEQEPPVLNHVRNHSNYLLSRGLLNQLRLPALFLAGAFHTLLLLLPVIVLLVLLTEMFFEWTSYFLIDSRHWLGVVGALPLFFALVLQPIQAGRGTWLERDKKSRRLGAWLLLAILSLLAIPGIKWLGNAVNYNVSWLLDNISNYLQKQYVLGFYSGLLWLGIGAGIGLIVLAIRLRMRLVLLLIGALAPVFLLALYVAACIYVINSPGSKDEGSALRQAIDEFRAVPISPNELHKTSTSPQAILLETQVQQLLETKQLKSNDYQIDWKTLYNDNTLVLQRHAATPSWGMFLTYKYAPQLHINFVMNHRSFFGLADEKNDGHIVIEELKLFNGNAEWWFYLSGLALFLYNYFFVNINRISMHPFYRDCLSLTFLVRPKNRSANTELISADDLKLSQLGGTASTAPYHLINTALNLQGSANPQLRERKTVPFVLAQNFCGSDFTGYCKTTDIEAADPNFNLGTAMAISAAAASPNMGAITVRPLTSLLALLNVRLNYWLPHPNQTGKPSWHQAWWYRKPGLLYLIAEGLGKTNERRPFINCSDGGHIENLAVYELLKRRCRTIVCIDGEADPSLSFFWLHHHAALCRN